MPLTPEQIEKLKKEDPELAAEAQKLMNGEYIPKGRFDEVNTKAREAAEKLAAKEAAEKTAEDARLVKQGEFQKLLETEKTEHEKAKTQLAEEKKLADDYRKMRDEELKAAKEKLGDKWLPEFDNLSLVSLRKLVGEESPVIVTDGSKPNGGPGKPKDYSGMNAKEFEAEMDRVKAGKK